MDGDELSPVGKRALDLDLRHHVGDALHDGIGRQDGRAKRHDLRDGPPVANHLEDLGSDARHGLGKIQLDSAGAPLPGEFAGGENEQFVDFAGSEMHRVRRQLCLKREALSTDGFVARRQLLKRRVPVARRGVR